MAEQESEFEMVDVVSTRVRQLGYNKETSQMRALFPNGALYEYQQVPEEIYNMIVAAPSVGSEFGNLIVKGPYSYRRIS